MIYNDFSDVNDVVDASDSGEVSESDKENLNSDFVEKSVFSVVITTPDKLIRYDNVRYLSFNSGDGVIGILPNHSNMISTLEAGHIFMELDSVYDMISKDVTQMLFKKLSKLHLKKDYQLNVFNKNSEKHDLSRVDLIVSSGLIKIHTNMVTVLVEDVKFQNSQEDHDSQNDSQNENIP